MSVHGIATTEEKRNLSSRLAILYLEKADIANLTPTELATKFFEIKEQIYDVVATHDML
jgi:hypothetical protein